MPLYYRNLSVSILVAVAKNNVIGKNNQLLWHLSDDLKYFRRRTLHHAVIMGRKTYDSIGRPLPKRLNIVVSRNVDLKIEGCKVAHSLKEAIKIAFGELPEQEIFIIGGGELYQEALPICHKIYLTSVQADLEGDAYFPPIQKEEWHEQHLEHIEANTENQYDFDFFVLERKNKIPFYSS